ncbi:MAG: cytochrome C [Terrimonas sp.]|nr:cytochrome C [Terrimonas sp.]
MRSLQFLCSILLLVLLVTNCNLKKDNKKPVFNPHPSTAYLSPEESLATMYLPEGYHMELVASEPMIQDPVAITWDGNGRMYVAEMLTYMKDADATGEQLPYSQVVMLEDTDHDGKMDKSTVFVDSLLLPRMIQSVGNELLVNETNSITMTSYRDTDSDGKADLKKVVYQDDHYVASDANMEHQRSGLDWNLDNWMYLTYEPVRFRYTAGKMRVDTLASGGNGQWGLTHDNYGRLFYSNAGGEVPVLGFQINPVYGRLDFPDQFDPSFQEVWPIIATPDVQGGNPRLRPNNTLNHFTASCGQSIYRGDALPGDMVGDYIVCEPVGRLIRRAKVLDINGKTQLKNAYDKEEFIVSSDMNFRPVNSATGPDGALYIVDMYRGIIQQANWTKPGSFIRKKIDSLGLAKNIDRGRIYRVVHDGIQPGPAPHMLDEPTAALIPYLGHPNGWWRDNAQRNIIIRGDKSVVPALSSIVMRENGIREADNALARLHALWTLEGLEAIDEDILSGALNDQDPQVRKSAVWISESFLKKNPDSRILDELLQLKNDPSYDVRIQLMMTMYTIPSEKAKNAVQELLEQNRKNEMIVGVKDALDKNDLVKKLSTRLGNLNEKEKRTVLNGAVIFKSVCANCHGADGKGFDVGKGVMAAPSLIGVNPFDDQEKDMAIRILLSGLKGPVAGKTYPSEMPSHSENRDSWIATVLSYARFEFGNHKKDGKDYSPVVKNDEVKKLREESKNRKGPWTLEELRQLKKD